MLALAPLLLGTLILVFGGTVYGAIRYPADPRDRIALGIVAGGAASYWASRLVGSLLFGIEPRDPSTFVGATIVLALVGTVAGAIPAWRASRVTPTTVMSAL